MTDGLTLSDACLDALQTQDSDEASCLLERRVEAVVKTPAIRSGNWTVRSQKLVDLPPGELVTKSEQHVSSQ